MMMVEYFDELIGYGRVWWWDEADSERLYGLVGFLVPAWRRRGIGRTMLRWMEERIQELSTAHPSELTKFFQVGVSQYEEGKAVMLEQAGYQPVRYFYEMVRPNLDGIPDLPLPDGLEIRPVSPDHYRAIWKSIDETSQDEWGYTPPTEEGYQGWLTGPHFQPQLWQVAWDLASGQVAGHVLTFINQEENQQLERKRGYTEGIGVDRAWRRRGLARALIARSLQAQKAAGMTESALAADSDSQSGITRLYESMGFQVVRRDAIYRKALQRNNNPNDES
jgi:mycothiol synthase